MAAAISGFHNLTGWADRKPAGPFGAYTDYIAPRFTAAAILAALEYRRRTGKGQYIDQSQSESALHFLSPALLGSFVLLGLFTLIAKKITELLRMKKVYAGWKRPPRFERNLVVIGAGAGGLVSSYIAAAVKAFNALF